MALVIAREQHRLAEPLEASGAASSPPRAKNTKQQKPKMPEERIVLMGPALFQLQASDRAAGIAPSSGETRANSPCETSFARPSAFSRRPSGDVCRPSAAVCGTNSGPEDRSGAGRDGPHCSARSPLR